MNVLVLPSWYPTSSNPYNGDFVKHQSGMLKRWGIDLSVAYADLDIRYLFHGKFIPQVNRIKDINDLSTTTLQGPFWPKNTGLGTRLWVDAFFAFVDRSIVAKDKPNVIHAHTYLAAAVAARIKTKYGIPYVVTEHYTGFMNDTLRSSHLRIAKKAFSAADQVFAVSESLAKSIKDKTQIVADILPNYIDTNLFQPMAKDNNKFRLVYVGDLIERKQVDLLISAFHQIRKSTKNITLQIVGDGSERPKLKKMVTTLCLSDHVNFLGKQSQKSVARAIAAAHCLVLPSKVETFGLVLMEALSCGVPVISFENGGSNNIFNSRHGIHVANQTSKAMAKAIFDLKNDYSKYDPTVLRKHILDNYSVTTIAPKLLSIYTQLIS